MDGLLGGWIDGHVGGGMNMWIDGWRNEGWTWIGWWNS